MFKAIAEVLLGCSHRRTTFPQTRRGRGIQNSNAAHAGTYVACLDCGKEFAYDWGEMRIGKAVVKPLPASEAQPMFR